MSAHCGGGRVDLLPPHTAYDVRIRTCRTVAAYHCLPSCAVATPPSFNSSAIARIYPKRYGVERPLSLPPAGQ
jgi:hypothetical protein